MIVVTTTRAREDAFAGMKRRAGAMGVKETVYAAAPPKWWLRIAEQTAEAGAVLVLDKGAEQPLVVMTLAAAEALATAAEKGFPRKT